MLVSWLPVVPALGFRTHIRSAGEDLLSKEYIHNVPRKEKKIIGYNFRSRLGYCFSYFPGDYKNERSLNVSAIGSHVHARKLGHAVANAQGNVDIVLLTGSGDHRGVRGGVHGEDLGCWLLLSLQRMARTAQIRPQTLLCHR